MQRDAALGLASPDMARAWASSTAWTVLDTAFGDGKRFLEIQRLWRSDVRQPRMLHYVGIAAVGTPLDGVLAPLCADLEPGFHRFSFEGGQISLTLCLGEVSATLSEHNFRADTIFAGTLADKWAAQLLARRCKRKTVVYLLESPPIAEDSSITVPADLQKAWLIAAGFVRPDAGDSTCVVYDPPWDIKPRRALRPQGGWAPERSAQVKEEPAQRAGDTEQNALQSRPTRHIPHAVFGISCLQPQITERIEMDAA